VLSDSRAILVVSLRDVNIVYATDARGVVGLAASSWSAVRGITAERPVNIWILERGLGWNQRTVIANTLRRRDNVRVWFVPVPDAWFVGLLTSKTVPRTAYSRLLMGDLLPENVERCVYLDIDTVCLTSVEPLHDHELSGRVLGAVLNGGEEGDGIRQFRRLGIEGSRYLNSGVLTCDLNAWRDRNVGKRALEFARSAGSDLVLHDQDALNAVLLGDWVELAERWNRWAASGRPLDGCIVHYTMSPKPWHADYRGRGSKEFWTALDQTACAGWRPWNPLGLGSLVRRIRSRIPHGPTVARIMRKWVAPW
jgi:lipopolysaccharide biosynthesis glycosyltransferase